MNFNKQVPVVPRLNMQALRKKVNAAKNCGRRDTVSDGVFPCQYCPGKEARIRVIRKHLMVDHNSWSFLKCNELLEDGEACEWFCHHGLRCFLNHAESFHQNFTMVKKRNSVKRKVSL